MPFRNSSGDECCSRLRVDDGGSAQALLGDDRVLVFTEEILQRLRVVEETRSGIAFRCGKLGGIAGALQRDAKSMKRLDIGMLPEAIDRLDQALEFLSRDPLEGNGVHVPCEPRWETQPGDHAAVAAAVESVHQTAPGGFPLQLEPRNEHVPGFPIMVVEPSELGPHVLEQHVEVSNRPRDPSDLAEEIAERAPPLRIDIRSSRAQEGTRAPCRHTVLVQVLRIVAEPNPRVVRKEQVPLYFDHLAQSDRAGVLAQRRSGHELLSADDAADQSGDFIRKGETVVPGLPGFPLLAPGKRQPPDGTGLARNPRQRDAQAFEIALERVVLVFNRQFSLRAEPILLLSHLRLWVVRKLLDARTNGAAVGLPNLETTQPGIVLHT